MRFDGEPDKVRGRTRRAWIKKEHCRVRLSMGRLGAVTGLDIELDKVRWRTRCG